MNALPRILAVAFLAALPTWCPAASPLAVKAVNKLPLARRNQTIEISLKNLAPIAEGDLRKIHVQDAAGKEVLCQAVDSDYDDYRKPDMVIFQSDFAPGETKTFKLVSGKRQEFSKEQFMAFGRFVRERCDDFAWENDRIAHRAYGKALETWKGEPLTSSTVDIWSKRTPRMVINDWYLADNYHTDTGEGADFYSAGRSRGCGGSGLWSGNQLWTSRNFVQSRVLANGPIRVMFELVYEPFDVNGVNVSEVKRISLDAGQNLDHFQSFYRPAGAPDKQAKLTPAVGLKKVGNNQKEFNAQHGWLATWEPMEKNAGMQGLAAIADPKIIEQQTEDNLNSLLAMKAAPDNSVSYWAGFAWDKAGAITTSEAWKKYMDEFAQCLASPIVISVSAE